MSTSNHQTTEIPPLRSVQEIAKANNLEIVIISPGIVKLVPRSGKAVAN